MGRDHFKNVMFTPNFVKDTREELGQYSQEQRIENFLKKVLRPFRALFGPRIPK